MDKLHALNELKELIGKGLLKYSEYDGIKTWVLKEGKGSISLVDAKAKLNELVTQNFLSLDAYNTLKVCFEVEPVRIQNFIQSSSNDNKTLHGQILGFILGLLLGLIGLILGIALGDEEAKSGAIKGFIVSAIIGIISGIVIAVIVSSL